MLTLHAARGVTGTNRRRVFSVRFLGDDITHAPRRWRTSPEFPGLDAELPAGAPMNHPLFPRAVAVAMKPSAPHSHRVTWSVFILLLLFAVFFVTGTVSELPPTVASHFDAAGQANAFMSRSGYTRFVLCLAIGLPVLVVAVLTAVYSRAADMKLPNRDYWLAPQRIAGPAHFSWRTAYGSDRCW